MRLDHVEYRFDVFRLEGRSADDKSIQNNTNRPSINFKTVPIRRIKQDLRGDIIRSPANGLLPLSRVLNERGQAKVPNLDIHIGIEEQISKLQVAMDNLVGVHIVARSYELHHEKAGFRFGKPPSTPQHVHQRAALAQLERHIDVIVVLKTFLESHNIGMVKGSVDLYFRIQLDTQRTKQNKKKK